jgi:hypothetical protein
MSISIASALTSIGGFLSGPIMTGFSNVASIGTLGVAIATKVDTHDMKSTLSGIRSDINALDNDILTLTGDVDDFRKENRWNVALSGGTPIQISNGGNPQIAQLQFQQPQQPQAVQQVAQPVQQSTPQAQPVQQQPVSQAQYITKDELNGALNNLVGAIPTLVGQAVQQALTPPVVVNPTPAPAPAPEPKTEEKPDTKAK